MTIELKKLLKVVRPRDTVQWLSDALGLTPHNAHALLYKQIPKKREGELIRAMLEELDRIDRRNEETRAWLKAELKGEIDAEERALRARDGDLVLRRGNCRGLGDLGAILSVGIGSAR